MADQPNSAPKEPPYQPRVEHRSDSPSLSKKGQSPRRGPRLLGKESEVHSKEILKPPGDGRCGSSLDKKRGASDSQTDPRQRQGFYHSPSQTPQQTRRPVPIDWTPPLAIGASLGNNLSRFEIAERTVLQWEAIVANAREAQPEADLSGLEKTMEAAKRDFEAMEATQENLTPV